MIKSEEVTQGMRGEPWLLVRVESSDGDRYEIQTATGQNVLADKQLLAHAVLAVNALRSLDPVALEMGFDIDIMRGHVTALIKQVADLQTTLEKIRKSAADYFEPSGDADVHVRLDASQFLRDQGRVHSGR
jgi:hypothetical protein